MPDEDLSDVFHGYKVEEHYQSMTKDGIKRPADGTGGNDHADWKGFYLAATPQQAAGYAVDEDGLRAGGVLELEVKGVIVQEATKSEVESTSDRADTERRMTELKDRLGVDQSKPFMDALGEKNTVLKVVDPTSSEPFEEIIVPWKIAENKEQTSFQRVIKFTDNMRGVGAASEYAASDDRYAKPSDEKGIAEWKLGEASAPQSVAEAANLSSPYVKSGSVLDARIESDNESSTQAAPAETATRKR